MIKKRMSLLSPLLALLFLGAANTALGDVAAQLRQAQRYVEDGDYSRAESAYQEIVRDNPGATQALQAQKELITLYVRQGKLQEADRAFERLLADFSDSNDLPQAVVEIAASCRFLKRYENSRQFSQCVVDRWPQSAAAMWAQAGIAMANFALREDTAAWAAVDKLTTDYAGNGQIVQAVHEVAGHCRWLRRYKESRQLCQTIVSKWPETDQAMWSQMGIAMAEFAVGQDTAASGTIGRLFTDHSTKVGVAQAIYEVGGHCHWLYKYTNAARIYQSVVDQWPGSDYAMWSLMGLAKTNITLGKDSEAQTSVDKLFQDFADHPDVTKAVNELGEHCCSLKKYEMARQLYQHVVDKLPIATDAIWAQVGLAHTSISMGDEAAAVVAIERLFDDFANDARVVQVVARVADVYQEAGKYDKARELHQRIIETWPDSEDAIWARAGLASANIGLGNDAAAQTALDSLFSDLSQNRHAAEAACRVANVCRDIGNYNKAREVYQRVLNTWPGHEQSVWAQMGMAVSNIDAGDKQAAQADIDKLTAGFKDHASFPAVLVEAEERYYAKVVAAKLLKSRELYERPVELWEAISSRVPGFFQHDPDLYYFIGCCYYQLGEYRKAIPHLQMVVDNWPEYIYARGAELLMAECNKQSAVSGL